MWSRLSILCALSCVALSAPLSSTPCPESCECVELNSGHLETTCSSLNFLEKLQPKQVNAIVSLDLTNKNLTQLHSKLKKLRNLKRVNLANNNLYDVNEISFLPKLTYLNLKSNHIKYFTVSSLSKYLKHIDISHNYLTYIPQEFSSLPGLKEVNLYDNPISCSCDTLKERDSLLSAGVALVKPVICHSPEKLRGQLLQTVSCTKHNDDPLDHLQGDETALEGSGEEPTEPTKANDIFDDSKVSHLSALEDEGFIHESPKTTAESPHETDDGSGDSTSAPSAEEDVEDEDYDEGSGDEEFLITTVIPPVYIRPKACNFDCSTPVPIDELPGENGTDPDILGELGKGLQEIFPFDNEPKSTTEKPISEEDVIDRIEVGTVGSRDEKEKVQEAIGVADANEIKEPNKSAINTNLIIVIALIVIMMCLVAFSVIRKRNARKNRPKVIEQEMKPLNSKPTNSSCNIPEKTPLMNGQNGNMNGKPVEEPVEPSRRSEELEPSSPPPEDDVDLRKKNKDEESLLPGTHRVTVQAKELSTPKTPLLVNRVRSGDGQFITTSLDHH